MLTNESIICFSSTEWVSHNKTSKRCLMEILSRGNKVLFVETVGSRNPGFHTAHLSRIWRRLKRFFKSAVRSPDLNPDQELWVFSPVVIPFHDFPGVRFLNAWLLRSMLKGLIKRLGFERPILWFYLPTAASVIGHLNEKKVIYHAVDDWSTYPGNRGGLYQAMDDELYRKADGVFVSNRVLLEKKKSLNNQMFYLPHGVNASDYETSCSGENQPPFDVRYLPHPVIAMIGAVSNWVDWNPLIRLAEKHPAWSILMIGPVGYDAELEKAEEVKNIVFLGAKKYEELRCYYEAIDVCVVSFKLTDHIRYCCPTRFYEHLAAGKPIVSTDFPQAHEFPREFVKIASSPEEFEMKVLEALDENTPEWIHKRRLLARQNTWESRAEWMSQKILEIQDRS